MTYVELQLSSHYIYKEWLESHTRTRSFVIDRLMGARHQSGVKQVKCCIGQNFPKGCGASAHLLWVQSHGFKSCHLYAGGTDRAPSCYTPLSSKWWRPYQSSPLTIWIVSRWRPYSSSSSYLLGPLPQKRVVRLLTRRWRPVVESLNVPHPHHEPCRGYDGGDGGPLF